MSSHASYDTAGRDHSSQDEILVNADELVPTCQHYSPVTINRFVEGDRWNSSKLSTNSENGRDKSWQDRTKLHFKSPTAERRHVLCIGVGGDRIHASRPGGAGHVRLSPTRQDRILRIKVKVLKTTYIESFCARHDSEFVVTRNFLTARTDQQSQAYTELAPRGREDEFRQDQRPL